MDSPRTADRFDKGEGDDDKDGCPTGGCSGRGEEEQEDVVVASVTLAMSTDLLTTVHSLLSPMKSSIVISRLNLICVDSLM